ncbi:hypothetical protein E8E13_007982 [Curvularia kusanoi]|uniref:Ubiquitin-like protease family profile domain-containing protein n=1 Tax=Curvularia kusanoi TaxID=90978 RepID=A0A9P4TC41_CURKU|nr:hypothetical protein E8E13_007982 [Curvularia kusanoi]
MSTTTEPQAGDEATPLPPAPNLVKKGEDIVNGWLNKVYLRHKTDIGLDADITVREFLDISCTTFTECLMPDNTIDVALALSVAKWERSNTIVVTEAHAQSLYALAIQKRTREDVEEAYPQLRGALREPTKRWVIIPCNDGMISATQGNTAEEAGDDTPENDVESSAAVSTEPKGTVEPQSDLQQAGNGTQEAATLVPDEKQIEGQDLGSKRTSKRLTGTNDKSEDAGNQSKKSSVKSNKSNKKSKEGNDKRKESSKKPKEASIKVKGPPACGNHWGLLVIDKQNHVARWVDSLISLRRKPGKSKRPKFNTMHPTARVAGQVLRGFDALLGEEEGFPVGEMTASTLPYNPNQNQHNDATLDEGACGPFMFEMLEYILRRASTLDEIGILEMFPRYGCVRFNSINARREIQRLIRLEAEKSSEADESKEPNNRPLPFILSHEALLEVLTPEQLRRVVYAYKRRPSSHEAIKSKSMGEGSESGTNIEVEQARQDNPALGDLEDHEVLAIWRDQQKSMLENLRKQKKSNSKNQKTVKGPWYLGGKLYHPVPDDDRAICPAEDKGQIKFPGNLKHLPNFASLTEDQVTAFNNKNKDIKAEIDRKRAGWRITARAMLQAKTKKTFLKENDQAIEEVWSQDPMVFDPKTLEKDRKKYPDVQIRCSHWKLRIMWHYLEKEYMDTLLKALERYRYHDSDRHDPSKDNDTSDSSSDSSGEDNSNNGDTFNTMYRTEQNPGSKPKYKKTFGGKVASSNKDAKSGKVVAAAGNTINDAIIDAVSKDAAGVGAAVEPAIIGNAVDVDINMTDAANKTIGKNAANPTQPNFRTMAERELEKYLTAELREDPRIKAVRDGESTYEPNIISYRALLFVEKSQGRFESESDEDCKLWSKDPLVFNGTFKLLEVSASETKFMMAKHYHPHKGLKRRNMASDHSAVKKPKPTPDDKPDPRK